MKQPYAIAMFLVILSLPFLFDYALQNNKLETRSKYLEEINALSGTKLSGPDKATFRDLIMTMNPETGKVPKLVPAKGREEREVRNLNWLQVPSREMSGRTRTMMIDPNDPGRLWIGTATGGMWYNPDFRNNVPWIPVSDDWESMSISALAYDPINTTTFYAGTGESFTSVPIYRESSASGVGIYKTTDGGASWRLLPATADFDYVNDIIVREENGRGVIYAAVASGTYQGRVFASEPSDGLYRSEDGGITWTQVLPDVPGRGYSFAVSDIELSAKGDLHVGTMRNLEARGGGYVLSSTDGLTWSLDDTFVTTYQELSTDIAPGRVILQAGDDVLYAISTGAIQNSLGHFRDAQFFNRIYKQETQGEWVTIPDPFQLNSSLWSNIPWHALAMGVDPVNGKDLIIGALDMYAINTPDENAGPLDWQKLTEWSVTYQLQGYLQSLIPEGANVDSLEDRYVHADVHQIMFVDDRDELLVATDGGIYYSNNISARNNGAEATLPLAFRDLNNGLNTLQFYTAAINPAIGEQEVMAGAQDNHTVTTAAGLIDLDGGIGYGDGAYCFFDADHPQLRITSGQANFYSLFLDREVYFPPVPRGGTFINPAAYDDRSNLLYTNMASDGGFEQLFESFTGRYLDTLLLLNVNKYLLTDDLGRDTISFVNLGTGSQAAFSAMKISPLEPANQTTMILGNQLGDVYRVTGLPDAPQAEKIDNNQLPVGYVSSVDIGNTSEHLLVTLSNYDIESVWVTSNGGENWTNLDGNLPDLPVRYGLFNPNDDSKIVIATERGLWGLENRFEESANWISYNTGLPNVRVDMIKARKSDSVIVAATHGRGIFLGKLDQGEVVLSTDVPGKLVDIQVYPNPSSDYIQVKSTVPVGDVQILDLGGKVCLQKSANETLSLTSLHKGVYLARIYDHFGTVIATKKVIKE